MIHLQVLCRQSQRLLREHSISHSRMVNLMKEAFACSKIPSSSEVEISFITVSQSAAYTKYYKNQLKHSDVLSFPSSSQDDPESFGQIVVCLPVILSKLAFPSLLSFRLRSLLIHSFVHLMGKNHQTKEQTVEMQRIERFIASKVGYLTPFHRTRNALSLRSM
jgi:rRNA maturation RNase YbeY